MKTKTLSAVVAFIIFTMIAISAFASPEGPGQVTRTSNQIRTTAIDNSSGGAIIPAQGGNVTSLSVNSTKVSQRWQGYYGNITGSITLDDANNKTLYSWDLASPQGEIYASNGSEIGAVSWSKVFCFNYTNNLSNGVVPLQKFNGTDVERMIGANAYDRDSFNSTFQSYFSGSFQVGTTTIDDTDSCMKTNLYANDAAQSTDFIEVVLTDNSSLIYTALLEQDATGFQGAAVDFEMLVGENADNPNPTTYYFFVELT